jgi:hypothetical protein
MSNVNIILLKQLQPSNTALTSRLELENQKIRIEVRQSQTKIRRSNSQSQTLEITNSN